MRGLVWRLASIPTPNREWQCLVDAVEKVAFLAKRRVRIEMAEQNRLTSCHPHLPGDADLGELAQVLGGSGEVELIPGTIGSA